MHTQDRDIQKAFFRLQEARRARYRLQRIWHPETLHKTRLVLKPPTHSTLTFREMLTEDGLGPETYEASVEREAEAKRGLEALASQHPLWPHFQALGGFGPYLCGSFVAAGGDIERAPKVSSFWKGMGLDVVTTKGKDGITEMKAPREERGRRDSERLIPAPPHVTLVGEQIRQQILRTAKKNRLYDRYASEKAKAKTTHPDWNKMHAHKHALRVVQKLLYAVLWSAWRQARGLPAPAPYIVMKDASHHEFTFEELTGNRVAAD